MYILFKYWVGQKVLWGFFCHILQVLKSFFKKLGLYKHWTLLVAQMVKNLPAMQETRVWNHGNRGLRGCFMSEIRE